MSDRNRPQLAPEVLEDPSTESDQHRAAEAPRRFVPDTTLVSTEQRPLPKAVTRPIVEVSPSAAVAPQERVREPLSKPVLRPIVEVVAHPPQAGAAQQ